MGRRIGRRIKTFRTIRDPTFTPEEPVQDLYSSPLDLHVGETMEGPGVRKRPPSKDLWSKSRPFTFLLWSPMIYIKFRFSTV